MTPVAPRIVLDDSCVTMINHEGHFSRQDFFLRHEEFSQLTVQSSNSSVKSQFSQVTVQSRNSSAKRVTRSAKCSNMSRAISIGTFLF